MRKIKVSANAKGFEVSTTDTVQLGSLEALERHLQQKEADLMVVRINRERFASQELALEEHIAEVKALIATQKGSLGNGQG